MNMSGVFESIIGLCGVMLLVSGMLGLQPRMAGKRPTWLIPRSLGELKNHLRESSYRQFLVGAVLIFGMLVFHFLA